MNIIHIGLGFVFVALGLPLALQKVAPNRIYGFRLPQTLSNEKTWYAANRVAGIDLCLAGVVITGGAIAIALWEPALSADMVMVLNLIILFVSMLAVLVHASLALRRL